MRNVITIIATMLIVNSVFGQSIPKDTVLYLTPLEEAFMIDKESKYLLKGGGWSDNNFYGTSQNVIGGEIKLSKSFSINASLDWYLFNDLATYTVEGRYYRSPDKLWGEPMKVNNVSGNYLSVGYNNLLFNDNFLLGNYNSIRLAYGAQRRFFNEGLTDISVGFDFFKEDYMLDDFVVGLNPDDDLLDIILNSSRGVRLSIKSYGGPAIGKKYKITDNVKCPIFRCYKDESFLLKFNTNQPLDIGVVQQKTIGGLTDIGIEFNANLNLIAERKIRSSPFSAEIDLTVGINNRQKTILGQRFNQYIFSAAPGLRWYFQQKNKIAEGESGNNLHGHYFLAQSRFDLRYSDGLADLGINKPDLLDLAFNVGFGTQRRVSDNMYFDFRVGLGAKTSNYSRDSELKSVVFDYQNLNSDTLFENIGFSYLIDYKVGILL